MNSNNSSGSKAWVILLAIIGGLFVGTKIFPLLSRILSLFLGIGVCLVIATIVLVIYFSCRKDQKPGGNPSQQAPPVGQGQQATREAQQGNTSQQSGNYGQQQGRYGGQNGNYGPNAGNFGQQRTAQQTAYRGTAGSSRGNVPPPQQNRGAQQGNPQQNQGPKAIPPCDLPPEVMQTLTRGRNHLTELRRILYKIANLNVKKRGEDICTEIEKILGAPGAEGAAGGHPHGAAVLQLLPACFGKYPAKVPSSGRGGYGYGANHGQGHVLPG